MHCVAPTKVIAADISQAALRSFGERLKRNSMDKFVPSG
jgi:hypothetical protein